MENKEILGYFNNKLTQELDEEDEINMVLSNHKKFKAQNLFNNQNKPLEWLNFFLNDSEIQEIYIQNDRIKSLIILQCLYYLSICNNIFGMKYRIAKVKLFLSTVKYSKLLEYILDNDKNINVLLEKNSETGFIYNNEKIEKMKVSEIIEKSISKNFTVSSENGVNVKFCV